MASAAEVERLPNALASQLHMQPNYTANSRAANMASLFSSANHSSDHLQVHQEQQQDASPSAQLLRFLDDSLSTRASHNSYGPLHQQEHFQYSHQDAVHGVQQGSSSMQRQVHAFSPCVSPSPSHSHSNSHSHLPNGADFHSLLNEYPSHSQHHSRVHSSHSQSQLALSDDESNASYMHRLQQHFQQAQGNEAAPVQFRQPLPRQGIPSELHISAHHSPSNSFSLSTQLLEQQISPQHSQFREHAHSVSSSSPSPASLHSVSPPPLGVPGVSNASNGVDLLPSVSPLANSSGVDWVCVCGNVNYGSRARCNMRRCQKTRAEGEIALILGGNAVAQSSKGKHSGEEKFPMQEATGGITLIPTGSSNSQRAFQADLGNPGANKVIAITQPKILPLNMYANGNSRNEVLTNNAGVIPMNNAEQRIRLQQERSPRSPLNSSVSSSPSPMGSARLDDNMWTCPRCGNRNYPHRQRCNLRKCGAERPRAIHANVENTFNGVSVTRPHLRESSAPSPSVLNPLNLNGLQSVQRFSDDVVKDEVNDWKHALQQMNATDNQFSLHDAANNGNGNSALQQLSAMASNSPPVVQASPLTVGNASNGVSGGGAMSIWICKWCNNANYGYRSVCNMRKCRKPRVESQESLNNNMNSFAVFPSRMAAKSDSAREQIHNPNAGNPFILDTTAKTMAALANANSGMSGNTGGSSHAQLYVNDQVDAVRGVGLHRQLTPEDSDSRQQSHHYSHSHSHSQSLSYSRSIASFSDDDQLEMDSATSPLQWHSDSDADQAERSRRLFSSDSVTSSRSGSGSASENDAMIARRLQQHNYPLVNTGNGNSHGFSQAHASISPSASSINLAVHERIQPNSHSNSPLVSPLVYPRVGVGGHPQTARLPSSRTESANVPSVHVNRGATAPLHSLLAEQEIHSIRSAPTDGGELPELLRSPPSSLHSPIVARSSNTILETLDQPIANQVSSASSASLNSVIQPYHSHNFMHSHSAAHSHSHAHYSLSSTHHSLPPKTSVSPSPTSSSSSSPSPSPAPALSIQHSLNGHSSYYSAPVAVMNSQHSLNSSHLSASAHSNSQHFQTPSSLPALPRAAPASNSSAHYSSERLSEGDSLHSAVLSAMHGRINGNNSHAHAYATN